MSDSPLVPTPIVDKNGKQTTVRRKVTPRMSHYAESRLAAAAPSLHGTTIAPEIDIIGQVMERDGDASNYLISTLSEGGKLSDTEIASMLKALHPRTLDSLDEFASEWKYGWLEITKTAEACRKERTIAHFNNLALLHDLPLNKNRERTFYTYVLGLQHYRKDAKTAFDYSTASEEDQGIARALLFVAHELESYKVIDSFRGSTIARLRSHKLTNLIASRPDDAPRLVTLLEERPWLGTYTDADVKNLHELLDQEVHSSLTDGVL